MSQETASVLGNSYRIFYSLKYILFFAPESLRPGGRWAPALAEAIAEATAFVLLVTDRGVGRWQEIEYDATFDRKVNSPDFPVVLLLLEGQPAPRLSFLKQLHWIVTPDPASERDVGRLIAAVASGKDAKPPERWRYTLPYRGLSAMEEKDSDYFFGRERETIEILDVLAREPGRLPVLLGNSGVGKSSVAKAGVIASLRRQGWPETAGDVGRPWPQPFANSRQWCFVTVRPGAEPIRALVEAFLEAWQFDAGDPIRIRQRNDWVELLLDAKRKTRLSDLLDETSRRYKELNQPEPPAFFLYIDQGEELYTRAEPQQRDRFSEIVAPGLADRRLRALMSIRADFLGALHGDEPLFDVSQRIDVPPLRMEHLREVVSRPAALLGARFDPESLAKDIARRTAEVSAKDVGALPLLSYLLDDMWKAMVERGEGRLRLPGAAIEPGNVLVDRANAFLANHPKSEDALRRILTLKLATVREDGEPSRRRALRSEFTDEEWRLVTELADHPNRLLVTATPEGREAYAEVAHEAIFRRWDKLKEWLAAQREFLAWKTGLEAARRAWQATPDNSKRDALLMGVALAQARSWLARGREDLSGVDRDFIDQSTERKREVDRWWRRGVIILFLFTVTSRPDVREYLNSYWEYIAYMWPYKVKHFDPYVLKPEAEHALKPGDAFRECAEDDFSAFPPAWCPEMIVIGAGSFQMGSPVREKGRYDNEGPQHEVVLPTRFAVSKFDVRFADWDACIYAKGCPEKGRDNDFGWGRVRQPVITVQQFSM
jgi:formylglycine-generating enzyme required for sulfatase activity